MKIILLFASIPIFLVGIISFFFTWWDKNDPCYIVAKEKGYTPIVSCTKNEIAVDSWTWVIVDLKYWEWKDCLAWCYYAQWGWLYYDWKILNPKMGYEWKLYDFFKKNYPDYGCFFPKDWVYKVLEPTRKYLESDKSGWFNTILEYNNKSSEDIIIELINNDFRYKAQWNFNYCILNWNIRFESDWTTFDTSWLKIEKKMVNWVQMDDTETLITKCLQTHAYRVDCVAQIALSKNEPELCKEVPKEFTWGTDYYLCIRDIVWKYGRGELCSQFGIPENEWCQATYKNSPNK